uniref:Ig-like domain-containing protein n=1 Tax=Cairina moschata TaxID=8855 RepID=A0A8C3BU02_CAIMO
MRKQVEPFPRSCIGPSTCWRVLCMWVTDSALVLWHSSPQGLLCPGSSENTFQTNCMYQSSNFYSLLWYQQKKGQGPHLISNQAIAGTKQSGRFTMELNTSEKSSVLRLKEDSAVYLCALSPHWCPQLAALYRKVRVL